MVLIKVPELIYRIGGPSCITVYVSYYPQVSHLCCHSEPGGALPELASTWGVVAGAGAGGAEEVDTLGDLTVFR